MITYEEKAILDYYSSLAAAKEECEEEIVVNMIKAFLPIEQIAEITGVSIQRVNELKLSIN